MIEREFSGKEQSEVVSKALDVLKLKEDQVKIEVENNSKNNIFSFGKKNDITVKIKFEEDFLFGNRALMFVRDLLEKMNIEAKIYLIDEDDDQIVIEIESPDSAIIIGKKGKTLESIQTLVNVTMNRSFNKWTKVIIDVGNYRDKRKATLLNIAHKAAIEVKKTGRPVLLEPMNPFERRIVHMCLKDDKLVTTESEGDGLIKQVRVFVKTESILNEVINGEN